MTTRPADGFYDAATARNISSGSGASANIVMIEIHAIKVAIDTAVRASTLVATVQNSTIMTQADNYNGAGTSSHFDAWSDPLSNQATTHKVAREQMNRVINYFTQLGYSISRSREGVNDRIQWDIEW